MPLCTSAINISENETTGQSPFYITYGWHPITLPDSLANTAVLAVNELADTLLAIQYMAAKNMTKAKKGQAVQANKQHWPAPTYTIGQHLHILLDRKFF